MKAPEIISHISTVSALFPILVFRFWRRVQGEPGLRLHIIALLIMSLLADSISYLRDESQQSTALIFNIQDFVQFGLISLIFYKMCFHEYKTTFFLSISTYVLFAATNSILIQPLDELQNMTWVTGNVIFILFSVTWMLHVLLNPPVKRMVVYGQFWINTACFVYFSMSLFLFVMTNYVVVNMNADVSRIFWSLHNLNNIIKNTLFAVAMFYLSKEDGKNAFAAS
jgi:hypothetical protein